jgi:predicted TIM-barrel fold metal-dependent hydrolase
MATPDTTGKAPATGRHGLRWLAMGALVAVPAFVGDGNAAELPIFDAHVHYSHDAWDNLPPKDAIAILRQAGLKRAVVSSSGDEGTQRLVAEAPDLVVPSLRPYRRRAEVTTWVRDDTVASFLEERLARSRYAAIGEFHVYGADADLPVPRRLVALAKQHRLVLHAHSDADAIERLFRQDPDARIVWAHSGFDRPDLVRDLLRRHRNLWCDLAFRSDQGASGKVPAEWRAAFTEFPDRFMVGTDTFTPERWHYIVEHARWSRAWLADLPPALAERIAWRNGEALFAGWAPGPAK